MDQLGISQDSGVGGIYCINYPFSIEIPSRPPIAMEKPLGRPGSWPALVRAPDSSGAGHGNIRSMAPPTIGSKRCPNSRPQHYTLGPNSQICSWPFGWIIFHGSRENPLLPIFSTRCIGELLIVLQVALPDACHDSHINDG